MLYNKDWDKKLGVLSLESLIAWLEQMPSSKSYNWDDCKGECLYGQYMASHGISWRESGACLLRDSSPERNDFCMLVYEHVASEKPHTFGAALTRARQALQR